MAEKYTCLPTKLPGIKLIEPRVFHDQRGFFLEIYNRQDFLTLGIFDQFIQTNHSYSSKNVLRGLHFQTKPYEMSKLVYCPQGAVLDVVVDVRPHSGHFGQWETFLLSDENKHLAYIPEGFAHGFLVLSETATIVYQCGASYSPAHDTGIIWNDPDLNIDWPVSAPILSDKDAKLQTFKEYQKSLGLL